MLYSNKIAQRGIQNQENPGLRGKASSSPFISLLADFLFGSLLLSPFFTLSVSLPAFRPDEMIALLIIGISLFDGRIMIVWHKGFRLAWPLIGFACAMMLTAFMSAIDPITYFTPRDLMEVFFPIKYLVLVVAGTFVGVSCSSNDIDNIVFWLILAGIIAAIIGLLQFMNIQAIVHRINPLYVFEGGKGHLLAMQNSGRVIGTTGNPNHFAAIIGYVMLVSTASLAVGKTHRVISILMLIIGSSVLVATISRVNYIAIPIAIAVLLRKIAGGLKFRRIQLKLFLIPISVIIVGYFCFHWVGDELRKRSDEGPSAFENRVESLLDFSQHGAYRTRYQYFTKKLDIWAESPFLGIGPSKSGQSIGGDNEYFSMLAKYGFIGSCMLFLFYFKAYRTMRRCAQYSSGADQLFSFVGTAFVVQVLIENLTGGVFYHAQVFGLLAFTYGIAYGRADIAHTSKALPNVV